MSKKEDAAYQEWLAEIKAKHPDVSEQIDALAGTDAGKEIYRGGLREADYYRRLNELRDEKDTFSKEREEIESEGRRQVTWWQQAKPEFDAALQREEEAKRKLEAYEKQMKENGIDPIRAATPPAAPTVNTKELDELKTRVQMMDAAFPNLTLGLFKAQSKAMKEGLSFDPEKVLEKVYKERMTPEAAFDVLSAEERANKAKVLLQQELDKAKEEGRREALSKLSGPDRAVRPAGPSIVDALRGDAQVLTDERQRRDAAVKDWMEMDAAGQIS